MMALMHKVIFSFPCATPGSYSKIPNKHCRDFNKEINASIIHSALHDKEIPYCSELSLGLVLKHTNVHQAALQPASVVHPTMFIVKGFSVKLLVSIVTCS